MMSLTITLLAAVRASEIGPSACYGVFARSFRERKLYRPQTGKFGLLFQKKSAQTQKGFEFIL
jgi:hypothetical protein